MKNLKIVVVAVPGGGKTTIMKRVQEMRPSVKIVNYGDVMLKIAKERYGVENRDQMRKVIPIEEYRKLQLDAAREIGSYKGEVLIDTHLTIKMMGGYYPGLPADVVAEMQPDVILLLEFRPEDVIERRKKDEVVRGGRDVEKPEEIELQQEMNRYFAVAAASYGRCIVKVMNLRFKQSRPFEHTEIAAKMIIDMLESKKHN